MSVNLGYYKQINSAFSTPPDLAGVIHGQRPVLRGAPSRRVSIFSSKKNRGSLILESHLERAAVICLESSSIVSRYVTQALRVDLSAKEYVMPDILVERTDGSFVVIEVKWSIKGLTDFQRRRYAICEDLLDREGIEFRLIDRNHLPDLDHAYRLMTLYTRGHQQEWSPEAIEFATELLTEVPVRTINQARAELVKAALPAALCDYLVFHRKVSFKDSSNDTVEIAA